MGRNTIFNSRKNKTKRNKKIILISTSLIALFLIIGILFTIKVEKNQEKIYANAEGQAQEQTTDTAEEVNSDNSNDGSTLDNSGYLTLDKDPNAEDAMVVFQNTEALLKRTKTYPVRTDGKKVAYLTFDDGPSTENTQKILDILDNNNIKATFFVTGRALDKEEGNKKLLKEIARKGHAIGNHTYSHDYKKLYPNNIIDAKVFMAEIDRTNEIIKSVLGKDFSTRVIRFPGGYWSWKGREAIRPILDQRGYAFINWNSLSEDAQGKNNKTAAELIERTKFNTENLGKDADSVVMLMHDTYGKGETVKALPGIIEYLKSKGFEFKTIK